MTEARICPECQQAEMKYTGMRSEDGRFIHRCRNRGCRFKEKSSVVFQSRPVPVENRNGGR